MTYIVNDNCIKCKYQDCVEVCPVDCFYVGENMLVIHPDECIDCGVCEPECPVEAILPDTESDVENGSKLIVNMPSNGRILPVRVIVPPMRTISKTRLASSKSTSALIPGRPEPSWE